MTGPIMRVQVNGPAPPVRGRRPVVARVIGPVQPAVPVLGPQWSPSFEGRSRRSVRAAPRGWAPTRATDAPSCLSPVRAHRSRPGGRGDHGCPNSFFVATAGAIVDGGRHFPLFVDVQHRVPYGPVAALAAALTGRGRADRSAVHPHRQSPPISTPSCANAARRNLPIIEDAAQAWARAHRGGLVGSIGAAAGLPAPSRSRTSGGAPATAGMLTTCSREASSRRSMLLPAPWACRKPRRRSRCGAYKTAALDTIQAIEATR